MPGPRGCGSYFGREATTEFLDRNNLAYMVRGHEACYRGSRCHYGRCWTVFSHPAYCGEQNAAAALHVARSRIVSSKLYTRNGALKESYEGYARCWYMLQNQRYLDTHARRCVVVF